MVELIFDCVYTPPSATFRSIGNSDLLESIVQILPGDLPDVSAIVELLGNKLIRQSFVYSQRVVASERFDILAIPLFLEYEIDCAYCSDVLFHSDILPIKLVCFR